MVVPSKGSWVPNQFLIKWILARSTRVPTSLFTWSNTFPKSRCYIQPDFTRNDSSLRSSEISYGCRPWCPFPQGMTQNVINKDGRFLWSMSCWCVDYLNGHGARSRAGRIVFDVLLKSIILLDFRLMIVHSLANPRMEAWLSQLVDKFANTW